MSLSSAPHQKTDAVVFSYAIDSAVDELTSYQKNNSYRKKKRTKTTATRRVQPPTKLKNSVSVWLSTLYTYTQ